MSPERVQIAFQANHRSNADTKYQISVSLVCDLF